MAITLIVIGAILIAAGIIGMVRLSFEPLVKAVRIVFFRDIRYQAYSSDHGRRTLKEEYKILKRTFGFLIVVGAICLGIGCYLRYAPHGEDSLFSRHEDENGISSGEARYDSTLDTANQGLPSGNNDRVIISGSIIRFHSRQFDTPEAFEEFIRDLDRVDRNILLTDDFAVSSVYHRVEALLNDYGIPYHYDEPYDDNSEREKQ